MLVKAGGILALFVAIAPLQVQTLNTKKFPEGFLFGTASSAYQIEGAWNEDGKTISIWDTFAHKHPEKIADGSNADVTCDSYHKYQEDVTILKSLGVDFYRFSLSWPRILPSGFANKINQAGVSYYNKLIDELLASNIIPVVTIYHWDLPQPLQDLGGFLNPLLVNWFEEYARVVFENFGDRVKFWTTFNEPRLICNFGYGSGVIAPGLNTSGIGHYICGHNLLKAHARAYHLYNDIFREVQKGTVGLVTDCQWYEPASNSSEDIAAAERMLQFDCGLYSQPVFSKQGDYPEIVKKLVANRSKQEGFPQSRLPKFTPDEIEYIKGTYDFIALNHYTTFIASNRLPDAIDEPSLEKDVSVDIWQDPSWPTGTLEMFKTVPWGFRKVLKWYKDNYDDPVIYISESGFPDVKTFNDKGRIDYLISYLSAMLDAIYEDGVRINGYAVWSLMDYYEWMSGYTGGFGMYSVNFSDPNRSRTPRESARIYQEIIHNRKLTPID